jgi:uncharacterized membrane protein YeiH
VAAFEALLEALTWIAVVVLAASGALAASRKRLDPVGFVLIACVTAFGGGTLRDMLLDRSVFWLEEPGMVALASAVALAVFFTAHLVERRFVVLLWADAVGLALFAGLGAEAALRFGADPWVAVLMGVVTATMGGVVRDIVCAELPLILRKEIYATAAALGAVAFVLADGAGFPREVSLTLCAVLCFGLRAAAIRRGWSLPSYRARPGRDYPDRD